MSATKKDDQQRFKREELERRKSAIFFTFEMAMLLIVIGVCIFVLVDDFPFYFKSASFGLIAYVVRSVVRHLTNKI